MLYVHVRIQLHFTCVLLFIFFLLLLLLCFVFVRLVQEQNVSVGLCASIKVLKKSPRAKEGMGLLKQLASVSTSGFVRCISCADILTSLSCAPLHVQLVAPIMKKHGWELPLLAEFFPSDPNLLGMNVNHTKILIRLRHGAHDFSLIFLG